MARSAGNTWQGRVLVVLVIVLLAVTAVQTVILALQPDANAGQPTTAATNTPE